MAKQFQRKQSKSRDSRENKKGARGRRKTGSRSTHVKERDDDEIEYDTTSSKTAVRPKGNHPEWYAKTPALLRDAASIPFSQAAGIPMYLGTPGEVIAFPGIMSFQVSLVPGTNLESDSPLNVAARALDSYIRHANSGARNWQSPNLMMYYLAMDSLAAFYSHAARMYGLLRVVAQKNRYYTRAIFTACGWDYDSFANDIAGFRLWLNTLVTKMGAMCVPANLDYSTRHRWLFENVFADGGSTKAHLYMYYPKEVFVYQYASDASAQYPIFLESVDVTTSDPSATLLTLDEVRQRVNGALEALLSYDDLAIMSGDIMKAFGNNIWKFVSIHEDMVVLPIYDHNALTQLHNMSWIDAEPESLVSGKKVYVAEKLQSAQAPYNVQRAWVVTQHRFIQQPAAVAAAAAQCCTYFNSLSGAPYYPTEVRNGIINMFQEVIEPSDVMVATRLACACDVAKTSAAGAQTPKYSITVYSGSEVVTAGTIVYAEGVTSPVAPSQLTFKREKVTPGSDGPFTGAVFPTKPTGLPGLFSFFPKVFVAGRNTDPENFAPTASVTFHAENYTLVSPTVLRNMHLAAVMSELHVPQMGAIV